MSTRLTNRATSLWLFLIWHCPAIRVLTHFSLTRKQKLCLCPICRYTYCLAIKHVQSIYVTFTRISLMKMNCSVVHVSLVVVAVTGGWRQLWTVWSASPTVLILWTSPWLSKQRALYKSCASTNDWWTTTAHEVSRCGLTPSRIYM